MTDFFDDRNLRRQKYVFVERKKKKERLREGECVCVVCMCGVARVLELSFKVGLIVVLGSN